MIRFDGYYAYEPSPYQERKEWSPDYLTLVYLFSFEGNVTQTSQWSKNQERKDFSTKVNFDEFFINEKELCILRYVNQPWKTSFYFDRISKNEFKDKQTGELVKFIPWE